MFITVAGLARTIGAAELITGQPLLEAIINRMPELGFNLSDGQMVNFRRNYSDYMKMVAQERLRTNREPPADAIEGDTD